jgi:hypothetical protein
MPDTDKKTDSNLGSIIVDMTKQPQQSQTTNPSFVKPYEKLRTEVRSTLEQKHAKINNPRNNDMKL